MELSVSKRTKVKYTDEIVRLSSKNTLTFLFPPAFLYSGG